MLSPLSLVKHAARENRRGEARGDFRTFMDSAPPLEASLVALM